MDSRSSSSQPPNGARARYLGGLSPEKQVDVLLKAERLGPAPDDEADWLVAQAASDAAKRIDEAAKRIEAATPDAAVAARLDRIEALLRRNGKPATEPVVSPPVRALMIIVATIAACVVVVTLFGLGEATFARVLAAFALGAASTLGYVALAPGIGRRS